MTGTFAGSAFFFPPKAATGASSVTLSRTSSPTRLLRLRITFAPASVVMSILLVVLVLVLAVGLSLRQIFVAARAKRPVVDLILRQQVGLRRRVRLMTGQAVDLRYGLRDIRRVGHIRNRMALHRMPAAEL